MFSKACEPLFGFTAAEILGASVTTILLLEVGEEQHRSVCNGTCADAKESGSHDGEVSGRRRDGTIFRIELSTVEIMTAKGCQFIIILRNRAEHNAGNILPQQFPRQDLLTPREREVLHQIASGASNKEAGRKLGISPRTVEVHRAHIMGKLAAKNAADLVRIVFSDPRIYSR
ncbi:MAG: two-component system, LuxR family, response regulator FixJ [Alphaproteobacteria bacterium]|nr:two-component system, LuxR family, response regulator FixJ [Alphaproteobacteria bacterium]